MNLPEVLITPPKSLKPIPEGISLKNSLPIIIENNNACMDNSMKLELLQEWVKSTVNVGNVRDELF